MLRGLILQPRQSRLSSSALPKLQSATGRARRRRRRLAIRDGKSANRPSAPVSNSKSDSGTNELPPYPRGRPWRVLWPHPHGNPDGVSDDNLRFRIPTWADLNRAWGLYMETWEDGIRGIPSPEKQRRLDALEAANRDKEESNTTSQDGSSRAQAIQDNAARNIKVVRESAQDLLETAKDTTGIQSQEDLRKVASDIMKLATECLKEFMAGYRKGRDEEVDKMLNEYFQHEEENNTTAKVGREGEFPGRRKPKRARLRD